jgi:hypothetical protein
MGNVNPKRATRLPEVRLGSGMMRTRASALLLIASLLETVAVSAIATERERSLEFQPDYFRNKSPEVVADQSKAIAQLIRDIDTAVQANKQRTLSIITINTDVAATTLEQQKTRYNLSFGEVYVAHALSLATRKKFDAIVKMQKSGKTWAQIARDHNVVLKGSRGLIKEMQHP